MNAGLDTLRTLVRAGALRFFHAIDCNRSSRTYGVADREYWAWKTKDFANGTWQGGLAGLVDAEPLIELAPERLRSLVEAVLRGTATIQRSNGSFEEAYPYESSYAVTGLVLFDLLYAWFRAPKHFSARAEADLRIVCDRALTFLQSTPETHGVIANHRMTTLGAILLGRQFQNDPADSSATWDEFLALQCEGEGWFSEYGGADPGYQTLLNHYWIALAQVLPLPEHVARAFERSVAFVEHFQFPDGAFSGEIGARGTAGVYPSGLCFADLEGSRASGALSWFLERHVGSPSALTPVTVDGGNFVPVFNAWALAYRLAERASMRSSLAETTSLSVHRFPKAELLVARSPEAVVALNLRTGALRRVVRRDSAWTDESVVSFEQDGDSTQRGQARVLAQDSEGVALELSAGPLAQPLNTPFRAIVLRLFGLLFFRFPRAQRGLKRLLAAFVMRPAGRGSSTGVQLALRLDDPHFPVQVTTPERWEARRYGFALHMASANTFDPRAL